LVVRNKILTKDNLKKKETSMVLRITVSVAVLKRLIIYSSNVQLLDMCGE
jgi:ribosomal protein L19